MSSSRRLRIGVVGCGEIAKTKHLPIWLRTKEVQVIGVCDLNEEAALDVAKKFNIKYHFARMDDMINKAGVNLVDVCVPPHHHVSVAMEAIEAGCHVIVEKPMAFTERDADMLIEAAKRRGVQIFPVHNQLFNPVISRAKSLIDNGQAGRVISIDINYSCNKDDPIVQNPNHWTRSLPGGIFGEILPHPIYILTSLLDELTPLAVVCAKSLEGSDLNLKFDQLKVLFRHENGIASIHISVNSPRYTQVLLIQGTKALIEVDAWKSLLMRYSATKRYGIIPASKYTIDEIMEKTKAFLYAGWLARNPFRIRSGHSILLPNLVRAILGIETPLLTAEDGRKVAIILEKITEQIP
jgi:predicted dehydrogenase